MFNPEDLFKSATKTNSMMSSANAKIRRNFVKKTKTVDYYSPKAQNNLADYFQQTNSRMFADNMKIFSEK